jgi:hypothetical protein
LIDAAGVAVSVGFALAAGAVSIATFLGRLYASIQNLRAQHRG